MADSGVSCTVRLDRKSTIIPARPSQPRQCKLCSSDLQILGSSSEGVVYINCNDTGAEFVEALAPELGVAEIMADNVSPVVQQLFHLNGALNMDGCVLPLLVVQIKNRHSHQLFTEIVQRLLKNVILNFFILFDMQATKLRDGLALGLTVNHSVIGGTSLWHFINCWAQLCRDSSSLTPNISLPPLHTRSFGTTPPINLNLHHHKIEKISLSTLPLREKMFHFTAQTISKLKREANQGASKDPKISSFQALCAHIWLAITRARGLLPTEETTFKLPVDCRPRIVPPLPSSYFGNAIQMVGTSIKAGELLGRGMGHAADLLHCIISGHQDANIRAQLGKAPTLIEMDKFIPKNCVSVGSSARFPMYENDFGWGRPIGVRSGWVNKFDGKMSAYPRREGGGSVDIEICLLPQTMSALESDPDFLFSCSH
ncbi:BAHD acyltransferase DCR [Cryptomeria japonica]|uniref:BAHD acyltransferase DCR n=1 Tax=Cryptomeria japonica TaxID=3369 RepID=UPI0027DAB434|nr:BAHD acyltransferase DCR [Cryptomeria japonica]